MRKDVFFSPQSTKRQLSPEKGHSEVKRQRRDEEASDQQIEEDEAEEERLAEVKLKHLQEMAEKSMAQRSYSTQTSTSSPSSKPCLKSSWQQIGNLMLYTAAGVKGSNKVWPLLTALFIYLVKCLRLAQFYMNSLIS